MGEAQREITLSAPSSLRVLLYRRLMLRVAEGLAARHGALAVVTGESLGQVASQTLENMAAVGVRRHPAAAAAPGRHRQGRDHRRGPPRRHLRHLGRGPPGLLHPLRAPRSRHPRQRRRTRRGRSGLRPPGLVADCLERAERRSAQTPRNPLLKGLRQRTFTSLHYHHVASARLPPAPAPSRRRWALSGRSGARLRRGGRRPGRRGDLHHRAPVPVPPGRPAAGRLVGRRPRRPAPGPRPPPTGPSTPPATSTSTSAPCSARPAPAPRSPSGSASRSTTTPAAWARWPSSSPVGRSTCCSARCTGSAPGASTRWATRSSTSSGRPARSRRCGTPTSPPSRSSPPPGPPTSSPTPTWPRWPASSRPASSAPWWDRLAKAAAENGVAAEVSQRRLAQAGRRGIPRPRPPGPLPGRRGAAHHRLRRPRAGPRGRRHRSPPHTAGQRRLHRAVRLRPAPPVPPERLRQPWRRSWSWPAPTPG